MHLHAQLHSSQSIETDQTHIAIKDGVSLCLEISCFISWQKKEAPLSPDQYPTFSKMLSPPTQLFLFSTVQHQRQDLPVVKQATKCDYFCALFAQTRARLHTFTRTVCRPASDAKQINLLCLCKPTI